MKGLPDAYDLRARIAPLILTLAPALALLLGTALQGSRAAIGGSALAVAALTFLAQIGRDRGRALQPQLWRDWGGSPAIQMLRAGPSVAAQRRRAGVEAALGLTLPTADEQQSDPAAADEHLQDAVRQLTPRATQEHAPQVWQENLNYGFRRNLLGLRPYGLAVAGVVISICAVAAAVTEHQGERLVAFTVPLAVSVIALVAFMVVVTPSWVRVAAEAYAERLLDGVPVFTAESSAGSDSAGK